MFYGSNVWDPVLIIAQIVSVQCLFYISLGLIQAVMLGPTLGHITVAYIFDWGTLHFKTKLGALNSASHVINAVAAAGTLAWIVERAKKCLDFGTTCYFWHMVFVCWYSGWPASHVWWLANVLACVICVLLGEWFCVRREMQDIPLSIPQRLSSGLLSRRKESGQVTLHMQLPSEDPDLAPRPRLRTGVGSSATAMQRPAAAAAAAGAFASVSSLPVAAAAPAAAGSRPASVVQLSPLNLSVREREGAAVGTGARKKLGISRAGSTGSLGVAGPRAPVSEAAEQAPA